MNDLKAIIIDDEEAARNVLRNLLDWSPESVNVVASSPDLLSGVEEIKKQQPDIVFLDVQMPDYAGYEIVRFLEKIDFEIIFVTAYDHYAIKAFEMSALDYLVKPVERNRLNQALKKASGRVSEKEQMERYKVLKDVVEKKKSEKLVISELHDGHIRQRLIYLEDIVAIEAMRAYSTIYLRDNTQLVVSRNLKSFEDLLPMEGQFIRSHRSWIVNSAYVQGFSAQNGTISLSNDLIAKITKSNVSELQSMIGI